MRDTARVSKSCPTRSKKKLDFSESLINKELVAVSTRYMYPQNTYSTK